MASRLTGAVILAGGTARRMGGVRKTSLASGGWSLVERTLRAARAACDGVVVIVGDDPVTSGGSASTESGLGRVIRTREDPPHGGPVAALAAAAPSLDAEWTLLLAGDLADGDRAVAALSTLSRGGDGSVFIDAQGREQWLSALVRTSALRAALATAAPPEGARLSVVLEGLMLTRVPDVEGVSGDVDTWQDLSRARARHHATHAARGHATHPARGPVPHDTPSEPTPEPTPDARRGSPHPSSESASPGGSPVSDRTLPPEALDDWAAVLRDRFGLAADDVPIALILDLARDVAHDVARPAAPLSAFVAGLVVGRAGESPTVTADTVAEIVALAGAWAEGSR